MKLSVLVPAHNEEDRIGRMLDAFLPWFEDRYGEQVEFLVIVNGSTDRTESVVQGYADRHPCVRCIVEPRKVGKGGALMLGFPQATGDLVGFVDADGATPPDAFQDLVDKIGDAGVIIASRWRHDSVVDPPQPLSRRLASRCFNILVRVLFGLKLTDTQCGAKLARGEAVRAVLPYLGITQWAFDVDFLFQLRRHGYRISEISTTWRHVSGSKLPVAKASFDMMLAIIRLRLIHSPFKFLVRFYHTCIGRFIDPHIRG
jgi:glycosyltransferase involved in cell wall biosynthesis